MKRLRAHRRLGALLGAALLVSVAAGPVAGHEAAQCVLAVKPPAAPAGTNFLLSGSGYTPAELILQREDGAPVTIELSLPNQAHFEIPISSQPGDEGRWVASVNDPDAECSASARFRVTLLDTAAREPAADVLPAAMSGWQAVMYLLVVVGGFAGGTLLARRTRAG